MRMLSMLLLVLAVNLNFSWQDLAEPRLHEVHNIYVGDMDNYYLNNAVYLAEEFLEST